MPRNIHIKSIKPNIYSYTCNKPLIIFLFILSFQFMGCDTIFPDQSKPDVPGDHTKSISGFMHKPGLSDPFHPNHGCSSMACHGDSLTGSVAISSGRYVVVPSCYQCHGALWETGESDEDHEGDD